MVQDFLPHVDTSWVIVGLLAIVSLVWLWTKTRPTYSQHNIPPFAMKPWPLVGNLFAFTGDIRGTLKECRQKAGDIYSVDLAGTHYIIINGFDAIKEVLVKHADNIPNNQHGLMDDLLGEYDMGIIGANDHNWKEQRTISLSILRSFGVSKNIMAENIQEEVSVFLEKLAAFKGKPEDVSLLVNISVSNVICSIIVGKRFQYDDPFFVDFMNHLKTIFQFLPSIQIVSTFPSLSYIPGDPLNIRKWARSAIEMNEKFSKAYINEFKKSFNENEEPQNFITAYLQEMKRKKDKGEASRLDEPNLVAIIRSLFAAGTETTSTTILWCLIYMLYHSEVQEKVYTEILDNVGTERIPNVGDKPKLTYLNAVIMETHRVASIVPGGFIREIEHSFELNGFNFPKGSRLWPMLESVHFDQKIWGDPDNFRPERFIDETGALLHREELIPFSIGRRACLGESLARTELFLFLSAMFQRFKLEPPDNSGELPSLIGKFGATIGPYPFKIRFTERKR